MQKMDLDIFEMMYAVFRWKVRFSWLENWPVHTKKANKSLLDSILALQKTKCLYWSSAKYLVSLPAFWMTSCSLLGIDFTRDRMYAMSLFSLGGVKATPDTDH